MKTRLKGPPIEMPHQAYDPSNSEKPWFLLSPLYYYCGRYGKSVLLAAGYRSDGASFIAPDIMTRGWWVHDRLTDRPVWDDGTPCSRWQSSMVLSDILREDGYPVRAWLWFLPTLIPALWGR